MIPNYMYIITAVCIILCIISAILLALASEKYNKAQGIIDSVALVMSRIKVINPVATTQSNLHEEGNAGRTVVKSLADYSDKPKKKTRHEENLESAVYAGVLHVFIRNKHKHERPVMTYKYLGEDKYFEYDKEGKAVPLKGKARESVLKVLGGEKCRGFKIYKLKESQPIKNNAL